MEDACPKRSPKYGSIASCTSGNTGVVALLSRQTRRMSLFYAVRREMQLDFPFVIRNALSSRISHAFHKQEVIISLALKEVHYMAETSPTRVRFEGSQPILRVEDMAASLRFYVDILGFKNASWGSEDFTSISRDGAGIYLCRGGQGRGGAWVWIGVEDAEQLHKELKA